MKRVAAAGLVSHPRLRHLRRRHYHPQQARPRPGLQQGHPGPAGGDGPTHGRRLLRYMPPGFRGGAVGGGSFTTRGMGGTISSGTCTLGTGSRFSSAMSSRRWTQSRRGGGRSIRRTWEMSSPVGVPWWRHGASLHCVGTWNKKPDMRSHLLLRSKQNKIAVHLAVKS